MEGFIQGEMTREKRRNELGFIYSLELQDRTRCVEERDNVDHDEAKHRASAWLASEVGSLVVDGFSDGEFKYYKVCYRREGDNIHSAYHYVNMKVNGVLYKWRTTSDLLRDIIRSNSDSLCNRVVVFYEIDKKEAVY